MYEEFWSFLYFAALDNAANSGCTLYFVQEAL